MTDGEPKSGAATTIVSGQIALLTEPLCFLVVEPKTGIIEDVFHPQRGRCVSDTILALSGTRGGGATPGQLCELLRLGAGPRAIVLPHPDPAVSTATWVAKRLYNIEVPVLVLDKEEYDSLADRETVSLDCVESRRISVATD